MPPENIVEPTLDYLKKLQDRGKQPVDIEVVKVLPDKYRVTVHDVTGGMSEFYILADWATFSRHHWEAVEFTGFGPRGLGNMIHARVCDQMRSSGLPGSRFQVRMSQDCCDHIGEHLKHWSYYGYTFHIQPALSGVQFAVELLSDQSLDDPDARA